MTSKKIIARLLELVERYAYQARVIEEIQHLDFDADIMKFNCYTIQGKAFGLLEVLHYVTDKPYEDIYEQSIAKALVDIQKANSNIVELLNLAGFNGEAYFKIISKEKDVL